MNSSIMSYREKYMDRYRTYRQVDCCTITRLVLWPVDVVRAIFPDPGLNPEQERPTRKPSNCDLESAA